MGDNKQYRPEAYAVNRMIQDVLYNIKKSKVQI